MKPKLNDKKVIGVADLEVGKDGGAAKGGTLSKSQHQTAMAVIGNLR